MLCTDERKQVRSTRSYTRDSQFRQERQETEVKKMFITADDR